MPSRSTRFSPSRFTNVIRRDLRNLVSLIPALPVDDFYIGRTSFSLVPDSDLDVYLGLYVPFKALALPVLGPVPEKAPSEAESAAARQDWTQSVLVGVRSEDAQGILLALVQATVTVREFYRQLRQEARSGTLISTADTLRLTRRLKHLRLRRARDLSFLCHAMDTLYRLHFHAVRAGREEYFRRCGLTVHAGFL